MLSINNFKRFFNQNIRNIIITIIVVIFIIGGIQLFNYIAKQNKGNTNVVEYNEKRGQAYSILSDTTVSKEKNEKNVDLIDKFIDYCNTGKIEEAYNLLTNECKELYYPTINEFIKNYYNRVFAEPKTYSVQSWITASGSYTYKVKILDDMMATGKYNAEGSVEDYYTIINNEKLNINKYIGRKEINKNAEKDGILFEIKYKDMYLDYEEYCINIKNNNNFNIAVDSKETTKSIYLTGKNDITYSSYIHELTIEDLIIESNREKEMKIKFNKSYDPERVIKSISISNIILKYDEYLEVEEKESYIRTIKIDI